MTRKRVVVTGMGVVAPNGRGLEEFSAALKNGTSGIKFFSELQELKFSCQVGGKPRSLDDVKNEYFAQDRLYALSDAMLYAGIAAIDAYRNAGLVIPEENSDEVDHDTGAIIGTGIGGIDVFAEKVYPALQTGRVRRMGSTVVEQVMCSSVSAFMGGIFALGNQVTTNSSACSTGTEAIIMGADRIRHGLAKRMIVGSSEAAGPYVWAGFDAMRVLISKYNDTPESASRPLSASAAGFAPGSGAGILILEDYELALARGARIYGEVLGTAINSGGMRQGGSMTAPNKKGVQACIRSAVVDSGIAPGDIDYVNGHLTATMADPHEMKNWSEALERKPTEMPLVNSTKSMIGHCLGAAGAIECVATLLQLNQGFVHGSLNCEDFHTEISAFSQCVPQKSVEKNISIAAKASFGFGDVNSCIIFKKF